MARSLAEPNDDHDHRRSSYDELLATAQDGIESEDEAVEDQDLLGRPSHLYDPAEEPEAEGVSIPRPHPSRLSPKALYRRAVFTRYLALLCACCLSIGSHYASYVLGPLKSRISRELGTSNTEFSLLISAYSLNSTWTPLVGGLLASKLGTTFMSIVATGIIFVGQILLLIGDIYGNIRVMAFGMFIFGLGVSPLAVVQETIIVRFFKSHGLGVSLAFGLIAGKGASFISARTSYPLTEKFGSLAPFYVATTLAGLSFVVNLCYIAASRWLVDGAGAELEAADIKEEARRRSVISISEAEALEKVAKKRRVRFREITKLGDIFWAYVGLNVLCGTLWSPFTHLAANIIQIRYGMTEEQAANDASYLLAWSVILYPICGVLVDRFRHRPIVVQLMFLSSGLTFLAYLWLALPPTWTKTSIPAIISFGIGHGFSPLLLVVIVPKIVSLKYVSTALGVHKSLEQTGSTIFQTVAGLALDIHKKGEPTDPGKPRNTYAMELLLDIFLFLNVFQLLSISSLAWLQQRKNKQTETAIRRSGSFASSRPPSEAIRDSDDSGSPDTAIRASGRSDEREPLLNVSQSHRRYSSSVSRVRIGRDEDDIRREQKRGVFFMTLSGMLIIFAWVLFMGTAWFRLGMKNKK